MEKRPSKALHVIFAFAIDHFVFPQHQSTSKACRGYVTVVQYSVVHPTQVVDSRKFPSESENQNKWYCESSDKTDWSLTEHRPTHPHSCHCISGSLITSPDPINGG